MKLLKLIQDLQALYDKEMESFDVMGEPEIMIDYFEFNPQTHGFMYMGFSNDDIKIERSSDGVYLIISRFASEDSNKAAEKAQFLDSPMP